MLQVGSYLLDCVHVRCVLVTRLKRTSQFALTDADRETDRWQLLRLPN
jgi:hypothetical protein